MPASTSFNPRTAYREDWRYVDGVEDGVLVVRDVNGSELQSHPVKLLRANLRADSVQYLWLLYAADRPDPPAPYQGNALVLGDGTELVIATTPKPSGTGVFEIEVQETPRNE